MRGIRLFKEELEVPFTENGDMIGYNYHRCVLKPNYIFESSLTYVGYSRGRSSIKAIFQDESGKKYEMFMVDFDLLLKAKGLPKPITGRWFFRKQGSNYGICLINENGGK